MDEMISSRFCLAVVIALVLAIPVRPASAQEMPVPIDVQAPLLLKVLKYEKTLAERAGDEVVIGILFQERFRDSLNARAGFIDAIDQAGLSKLLKRPTRHIDIELAGTAELGAIFEREGVDILYVAPLRAASLGSVVEAADAHQALTLSGVPDYVENGVMVGITERRSRPSILLNLDSASGAGIIFSSEILKVAQIVGR